MREYLLFIDTEASGLPKKWNVPYSHPGNWPHAVQISWLVYTTDGQQVKHENHYVKDNDFEISPSAIAIHGITREFLLQHGENRYDVLTLLSQDLQQYQPLVIGHFMKFDAHVLGADFYRTGLSDPLISLPTFCTMEATTKYVRNPQLKYLRLGQLYALLFNTTLEQQHNALVDAQATAECFFELLKRGEISSEKIAQQQITEINESTINKKLGCGIAVLGVIISTILTYVWL